MSRLSYSIVLLSNAYLEYVYVPWLGRNVYRGTVDYKHVCLQ